MSRSLAEIPRDQPITLEFVSRIKFDGAVSVASLMAEHSRGRLVITKIGRSYYTTLDEIDEMLRLCRVPSPAHVSGSAKNETRVPASPIEIESARAAARASIKRLRLGKSHRSAK